MEENFPNLRKDESVKVREAHIPNGQDQKRNSLSHKNQNTKCIAQRILKALREETCHI